MDRRSALLCLPALWMLGVCVPTLGAAEGQMEVYRSTAASPPSMVSTPQSDALHVPYNGFASGDMYHPVRRGGWHAGPVFRGPRLFVPTWRAPRYRHHAPRAYYRMPPGQRQKYYGVHPGKGHRYHKRGHRHWR